MLLGFDFMGQQSKRLLLYNDFGTALFVLYTHTHTCTQNTERERDTHVKLLTVGASHCTHPLLLAPLVATALTHSLSAVTAVAAVSSDHRTDLTLTPLLGRPATCC